MGPADSNCKLPSNFNLITGFVIAGVKVTKESGYADLKDEVNAKCGTKWTADMAKSRYITWRIKI